VIQIPIDHRNISLKWEKKKQAAEKGCPSERKEVTDYHEK